MDKKGLPVSVVLLSCFVASLCVARFLAGSGPSSDCALASVSKGTPLSTGEDLPSTRRMLAAQIALFTARDYTAVKDCLLTLKAAGVNTVIVRAFQNRSDRLHAFAAPQCDEGVYFETGHAPVVDPVMRRVVSIGHDLGMKVFAWMETRKMPLRLYDPGASRARLYSFETGSLEQTPMWSIFDQAVEKGLIGLYEDVSRTGVDGILIQDDLVMHHNEDFSAKAVALFERETGRDLDPETLYKIVFQDTDRRWLVSEYSDTFWTWARWKNRKLLSLADKLIQASKSINPQIQVAMNFMYESVTDPKNALAWLSQDLPEATRLPIDYYAIMAYHRQMKKELGLSKAATYDMIAQMTTALLKQMDDPHRVLMKVQMCDWETFREIPSAEADEVFQRINGRGHVSLAIMPYSPKIPLHIIMRHFRG